MIIKYGTEDNCIDVTEICLEKLRFKNNIIIPVRDYNRANYFSDPAIGVLKKIFIINDGIITEYNELFRIIINLLDNSISTVNYNEDDINAKIQNIHSKLTLKYGYLHDELPEQKMVVMYLSGNEKVLEIGGNIGRNSLTIASIIKNQQHLVTLESDDYIASQLTENRDLNNFTFNIENYALSKRKLIQKGWDTVVSDELIEGYKLVKTITWEQLQSKYNIEFDTLVLDCEGAFYYILMDMPEILENIHLIIM